MLPNEILCHIFSFLDHNTLKTCAAVCPDLAERHLYAAITIRDFENSHCGHLPLEEGYVLSHVALDLLINKKPRVAQYARTLFIDLPLYGEHKTSFVKLTSLESLSLRHPGTPYCYDWPRLDSDFKSAFLASLRFPCLKEKLTIQAWDVNTETVLISSQLHEPQLESLQLIHRNDVIEALISRANLANLNHLFLKTAASDQDGNSIMRLFQACSASLKTLQVHFTEFHAKAHDLHLRAIHHKTHITFPLHLLPESLTFSVYLPVVIIRVNERYVSHLPTLSHALHVLANDISVSSCKKTSNGNGNGFSLSIYLHFVPRYSRFDTHSTRLDLSALILNYIATSAKGIRRPIRILISASEMGGTTIPAAEVLHKFDIYSELSSLIEQGVFVVSGTERRRSWPFEY